MSIPRSILALLSRMTVCKSSVFAYGVAVKLWCWLMDQFFVTTWYFHCCTVAAQNQKISKNDKKCKCQAPEDAHDKKCQKTTKNVNVDWKDLQMSNICRYRFLNVDPIWSKSAHILMSTPPSRMVPIQNELYNVCVCVKKDTKRMTEGKGKENEREPVRQRREREKDRTRVCRSTYHRHSHVNVTICATEQS